jgi:hypothetical protein
VKLKIEVTRQDIEAGLRDLYPRSCRCPVALAVKRCLPDREVAVCQSSLEIDGAGLDWTETAAPEFIRTFDQELARRASAGVAARMAPRILRPFTFEQEIP